MTIWSVGLTTRASAARASKWGGVACLFQGAREALGSLLTVSLAGKPLDNVIAYLIGASLLPILLLVAGIRLWRHAGWIWGGVAGVIVASELAAALFAPEAVTNAYTPIMAKVAPSPSIAAEAAMLASFAVKIAILGFITNGIRGALALRRVDYSNNVLGSLS